MLIPPPFEMPTTTSARPSPLTSPMSIDCGRIASGYLTLGFNVPSEA